MQSACLHDHDASVGGGITKKTKQQHTQHTWRHRQEHDAITLHKQLGCQCTELTMDLVLSLSKHECLGLGEQIGEEDPVV